MLGNEALQASEELVKQSTITMLGSIDEQGFPNIKSVFVLKTEGLNKIWFNSDTSAQKVTQFRNNSNACAYYVDRQKIHGLMLKGEVEIIEDIEVKKIFWNETFNKYYPMGVMDKEFSILCFKAFYGRFYNGADHKVFEFTF
jgi:general stress protein 26